MNMKKSLIMLSALLLPLLGMAQSSDVNNEWVKNIYILRMSPNGQWLGSMAGNAAVINFPSGEPQYYDTSYIGLGNSVANTGVTVGSSDGDIASVMIGGKTIVPDAINPDKYWFCGLNAITPDGTKVCGIVNNTSGNPIRYIPFVASINPEGVVSDVTILPYPELDFFNAEPAFVTAVWISDDGKTVAGQVVDWRGMYSYPIVFSEAADGKWSYKLPSAALFNPSHIEIPANPWREGEEEPEPEEFMSGAKKAAYLKAYEEFSTNGGPEPNPLEYMTDDQKIDYQRAVTKYNVWFNAHIPEIKAYEAIYSQVLENTPTFFDNELALSPDGKTLMLHGGLTNKQGEIVGKIYSFDCVKNELSTIYDTPTGQYFPQQILPDGTMLATKGLMDVPNALIYQPGSTIGLSVQDYLADMGYPELAEWLEKLCSKGTGVLNMNNDKTLITGALMSEQIEDFDYDNSDYYFSTYFIAFGEAGIESLAAQLSDGTLRVFTLQGVKVMETKEASDLYNLPSGIYIINGKKVIL